MHVYSALSCVDGVNATVLYRTVNIWVKVRRRFGGVRHKWVRSSLYSVGGSCDVNRCRTTYRQLYIDGRAVTAVCIALSLNWVSPGLGAVTKEPKMWVWREGAWMGLRGTQISKLAAKYTVSF